MKPLLIPALLAALGLSTPVLAKDPAPFPQFEAKRVKPPSRKSKAPRIQVQIDPSVSTRPYHLQDKEAETTVATASTPAAAAPRGAAYDWFWQAVSPDIGQSGPGRLDQAVRAMAASNAKVSSPRLQTLQDIAKAHGIDILKSTIGTEVSPALVLAVISVESAGKADAVSSAGAQGLMQLMPATAERFGVTDTGSAAQNISGGVKYLDWLMKEFDRDPILVLAGYNAGEGAVKKHAGVPPFAETRDYVPKVLAAFQTAKGLCLTPPQLVSDGCVFAALNN